MGEIMEVVSFYRCAVGRPVLLGYWACRLGTAWRVPIEGSNKVKVK